MINMRTPLDLRLATAIVAFCAPAMMSFAGTVFIEKAEAPKATEGGVLFTFEAPNAQAVYLAGDFNSWGNNKAGVVDDPAAAMEKSSPNGIWYKVLDLSKGHASYKFVVTGKDGKSSWFTDPLVMARDADGNSVYDPENATALQALYSSPGVKVLSAEKDGKITVSFLNANGSNRQSVGPIEVLMDGVLQEGLKADATMPGRMANEVMWVEAGKAGDRSAALTFGAKDDAVHIWDVHVPSNDTYYGGGERFNSINQKGYTLQMRSLDHPGEKGATTYKPVPFIMSSSGFGFWVDSFAPGSFDLNSTARYYCNLHYEEDQLRVVFIDGPKYADMLKEYTALSGRAPVPPAWSFGTWKSRNVHKNREEILEDVELYRKLDIPGSVLVIDSPWERGYNDFVLNDEQFTEPEKMFARVDELGFYTCLWLTPFVNSQNVQDMKGIDKGPTSNYEEAAAAGHLVEDSTGKVMTSEWWKGKGGLIDFTDPEAVEWFFGQLDQTKKWGVKAWKCDDGEGNFVGDAVFYDGTRAAEMKGRYGYLYLETLQKYIDERMGGDGVLFARPGFAGSQKFPYCWAGDNHAGWEFDNGLPGVIRAGQNAGMSGLSMWAHDISGYHGTQTPELFKRWTQFGCFTPMMQLHMTTNLGPWDFGDEGLEIYRKYAKLHTQLFPYIYAAAHEAHETGMPIIRSMALAFQDDDMASHEDFQYMFGPDLLVAPFYQPGTHRTLYLPEGNWIYWWSGEKHAGGKYLEVEAPIDQIPLFVRAGAVIPMLPADVDTLVPRHEGMAKDVVTMDDRRILQVWPGASAAATAEGITISADGSAIKLSASSARPLEVHLMHQKVKAKPGAGTAPDSVAWNDEAMATVLSWKSFSGEGSVSLQ